jgi:hypothetical protein
MSHRPNIVDAQYDCIIQNFSDLLDRYLFHGQALDMGTMIKGFKVFQFQGDFSLEYQQTSSRI